MAFISRISLRLAILLTVIMLLTAGWFFLPFNRFLQNYLDDWLARNSLFMLYDSFHVDWDGITFENVSFKDSDDFLLSSLSIDYNVKVLLDKKLSHITLHEPNIQLHQIEDGTIHFTPADDFLQKLKPLDTQENSFSVPNLPFDKLTIKDALLTFIPFKGKPIQIVFDASLTEDYCGEIHVLGANIPLASGGKIEISDMVLERQDLDSPYTFSVKKLAHNTDGKAWFTPLQASGEINTAQDNNQIDGMVVLSDLLNRWKANISGKADLHAQNWNIGIDQPAVMFESGILQPDQLFPFLRGKVKDAKGSFSLNGRLEKQSGKEITSGGNFTFQQIDATLQNIKIKGLNGKIDFSSLFPLTTQGRQSIKVEEINLGLPLQNGELEFIIHKKGKVILSPTVWQWAGGQLTTGKIITHLENKTLPDVTIGVKNLAVKTLLSSLLKDGFDASGTLDGTLPLTFKNGNPMILNGNLSATGGGQLRYIPPAGNSALQKGQSFQTDLLLSALEDFHYDSLHLDISNQNEKILALKLHLRGKNPALYDGQIVELNVNLSGNLLEAVQSSLNVYSLPKRLEEQLVP